MEILQTTDYEIFKKVTGNREIDTSHVYRLATSIEKKNMLDVRPIIVNERMEVVDGQNRLEAAKLIGCPIYYVVSRGADYTEVALLNSNQKNWSQADYLRMYAKQGYPHYKRLLQFVERHKDLNVSSILLAFHTGDSEGRFNVVFRDGGFKFNRDELTLESDLLMLKKFIERYKIVAGITVDSKLEFLRGRHFFRGWLKFCTHHRDRIHWDILFEHIGQKLEMIAPRGNTDQYYKMVLAIYNFRLGLGKLREYDAEEEKRKKRLEAIDKEII